MKEKRECVEMKITLLKDTEEHLREMAESTHSSVGHMVDRLVMNWAAKEPAVAAYLILEDLLTHTINLDYDEINQAITIVLAAIKESLADNDPKALKKIVHEIEEILNQS